MDPQLDLIRQFLSLLSALGIREARIGLTDELVSQDDIHIPGLQE